MAIPPTRERMMATYNVRWERNGETLANCSVKANGKLAAIKFAKAQSVALGLPNTPWTIYRGGEFIASS